MADGEEAGLIKRRLSESVCPRPPTGQEKQLQKPEMEPQW